MPAHQSWLHHCSVEFSLLSVEEQQQERPGAAPLTCVQLQSRHWIMRDERGQVTSEIKGDGVIGRHPILRPGGPHPKPALTCPSSLLPASSLYTCGIGGLGKAVRVCWLRLCSCVHVCLPVDRGGVGGVLQRQVTCWHLGTQQRGRYTMVHALALPRVLRCNEMQEMPCAVEIALDFRAVGV